MITTLQRVFTTTYFQNQDGILFNSPPDLRKTECITKAINSLVEDPKYTELLLEFFPPSPTS